ncbi:MULTISPECIES: 4-hydroxyphenylacetate 3-hydroxylase family protein [Micrococcaceae]|uniref:4-hydroxyphenylacetate 3-monooxygenase n=4 Tax=Micrococcaceae TaxID=1268 RepID=A0ACC6TK80_9MICC|nr:MULTISPECIES: 4-hydroxyphenylacetate 3-hydroxylase N-terminal domain-containing protein [Micrococcaceae]AAN08754.1 putative chlorophenol monooxygenase large subunit [Pseudarthrobacter chlorophenolicus]ACL42524.1 4-hydroxyphenylacetate 3-hydroxylase [Pseudarthrobacter chlorophenolicus A6]ELT44219.1 4-hydroxyphenylacetate 3-hydroxylase [Arthrobacter nitrophenolicus]SDQ10497.1 4-hydroxyphenylacetate 3-monooxygenase [Pseudarthrobacter chlorophenolicus]
MRTGKEYLESLRDGRKVYVGGELIEDVTTHPKTKGYAQAIAEYYDLHLKPENQDLLTFVDENGKRESMHWFLPRSKEDVIKRRNYADFIFRHFQGGIFTRPPAGMNVVMFTQVDDQEPWAENSRFKNGHRDLSGNIQRHWDEVTAKDLAVSPMFVDVQYDRGRDDSMAETPMLSIIEENDEGIVVRGWKAIGTSIPFVNNLLIGNLWRPGQTAEQTIYAMVPLATPGVSVVARESRAQPDADPYDRPLATLGDELDGMVYFDDVLITWDQVQHVGNPEHAKWYPQRQFDWVHLETQIRQTVHAELMVGLGLLITQALGTSKNPVVQSQLAELIRFRETCRAFMIAAEETGFHTPGGLYKPNNIFIDFGRAHYLEHQHEFVNMLIEFCGRGIVIQPTKRELDHPYIGPKLQEALRGSEISARDRIKIFRQISERFLTEFGSRHEMFEKFNGTPPYLINILTMQRTEYQVDGPLTQLARDVLGFGDTAELGRRAEEAEKASHYASVKYQPEYARSQDVHDGYIENAESSDPAVTTPA